MHSTNERAVLLVGHGRRAQDTPPELLVEFQRAKSRRVEEPTRFTEAENAIRLWPRTAHSDPYWQGLQDIAEALRSELPGVRVSIAFNEFCAPSIEDAVETLAREGVKDVTAMTTMITPGGNHAERDIPEALEALSARFPELNIDYVWPFSMAGIASFLATAARTSISQEISR